MSEDNMRRIRFRYIMPLAVLAMAWGDAVHAQQVGGRVLESESLVPLANATVTLLDAEQVLHGIATTDTAGAFVFDRVSPGRYMLQAESEGRFSSLSTYQIADDGASSIVLVVPSMVFELSATCTSMQASMTVLAGVVYDSRTGVVLPGARVTASWEGNETGTVSTADDAGRYRFCGVPVDRTVRVRIAALGRTSETPLDVPDVAFARADLDLDLGLGASRLRVLGARPLADQAGAPEIRGRIVDMDQGNPVQDVIVRAVGGRSTTVSAADGRFVLEGLAEGDVVLEVEHVAFGTHREYVVVRRGLGLDVELLLAPRPVMLAALEASAEAASAPFARASASRLDLMSGSRLAQAEARGARVADVLRDVPGLNVVEGWFTTRGGVENGVCLASTRRQGTLREQGSGSQNAPWCESVPVILDGVPVLDAVTFLRTMNVADYESIQVISAADAQIRYGLAAGAAGGAVEVWTRGRGPHVSQARNIPPQH